MAVYRKLTAAMFAATLALGVSACGGGGGGGGGSGSEAAPADEVDTEGPLAIAAAIQAAGETGADKMFDDTVYMVAPTVAATHDGTAVTIEVAETGTPLGGIARAGDFVALDDGPAPIAGWTGARLGRGEAAERLVAYSDVAAPEAMAFSPENLNLLNEVSGLTGETIPASGLAIEQAWLPVMRSISLAAAPANGSITHPAEGMGANVGLEFVGTFGGGSGHYRCSGSACSVTLDDGGMPTALAGDWIFAPDSTAANSWRT